MITKFLNLFIFLIIIFQIIFSSIFISQYNLPDGVLHQLTFENNFSNRAPSSFYNYLTNFDMYNISIIQNIITNLYPIIKNQCLINYDQILFIYDTCGNQYNYNNDFTFGGSKQLYKYSNLTDFNDLKISLLIYIFIINLIFFLIIISFKDQSLKYTFLIFLFFPSVINTIIYISPNISSIYFQLILFYFFLKRNYLIYFILAIFLFILDLQNITNFAIIVITFVILFLNKFLKINIKYYNLCILFMFAIIFLGFLKYYNYIFFLSQFISTTMYQNYTYLNSGDNNFFRSLIVFGLSLYYIGGSMSHLAFFLEYLFFVSFVIFFLFYNIFIKKFFFKSIFLNPSFLYFLIGAFAFLALLIIFSNFNQGRYGLFLLPPIIYFYFNFFKNNRDIFIYTFISFFILNNYKIIHFMSSAF